MKTDTQQLIISIIGASLIITLIGTILIGIINGKLEIITLFIGIITTLMGILATALQGKKMTEKQQEILKEQTLNNESEGDV